MRCHGSFLHPLQSLRPLEPRRDYHQLTLFQAVNGGTYVRYKTL